MDKNKDLIERMAYYANSYTTGNNLGREIQGTDELLFEAIDVLKREGDMVKIVRCRDCLFWDKEKNKFTAACRCKLHSSVTNDRYTGSEDFCSYGEQRRKYTNYEWLMERDIYEMAAIISGICSGAKESDEEVDWLNWLESEVEE